MTRPILKLAYLINTYPQASLSFVRREIHAIERRGHDLHRFALRADRRWKIEPSTDEEMARTEHILALGWPRLTASALVWMLAKPLASLCALRLAMTAGRRGSGGGVAGTGGRLRHLAYLIEAAHLARRCHMLGIEHLHAHFGTNSATVAMLCHALHGPRYSFTCHGPEEFDAAVALSLPAKLGNCAAAIAVSSFGRSQLCRWCAVADWPKLHVVHCGIEPWLFPEPADPPVPEPEPVPTSPAPATHAPATAATPAPSRGPHLVAIGRLAPQKGFALLIETLARACVNLPGLHLTLLGDGELRPALEMQIAALRLGARVTLAGWQSEAGVRAALARADALILPSFAEGLPVVIMEAMAAGRPVIATAIAGIPELLTPETGWLVPAGDSLALQHAIEALAALSPAQLADMGRAARARILERHAIDDQAALLERIFTSAH
jgi:colanic acid/amylovoran biosynthesis glycosyltransferase